MTYRKKIVIVTRQSPLALWQARWVAKHLQQREPALIIQLAPMLTEIDRQLETPLNRPECQGIFVRELEQVLLEQRADLAVHSVKDLPIIATLGLAFSVFGLREDAREALVADGYATLEALPAHARVGTSSLLRQYQLSWQRSDFTLSALRGDIGTRLKKLTQGEYDALILAVAGLKRLGLATHISGYLPLNKLLPAVGQGALGVQYRTEDSAMRRLLTDFEHPATQACVFAERALARRLVDKGLVAVGAYARAKGSTLQLRAVAAMGTGVRLQGRQCGPLAFSEQIGITLADTILAQQSVATVATAGLQACAGRG